MISFCLFIHLRGPGESCGEGEMQQCRNWDDNNTSTFPGLSVDPADFFLVGFFAGDVMERRTEGPIALWRCGAACLPVL